MAGRKSVWKTKVLPKLNKVTEWRGNKYTYLQIAKALGICEKTFHKYLNEKPELREAIELGDTHIEHEIKNKLIDLCLGGIKKEKKFLIVKGKYPNGNPIYEIQKLEVDETLPSLGAIKYYLDKRDGSYNTYNNNNENKNDIGGEIIVKGSSKEQEALSIRLQNIVERMDKSTKKGTGKS